jgi:transcriptional regulator GlxA family with amidase domain
LSSGHVPSADCCLDIIMDDLAPSTQNKVIICPCSH